MSPSGSVSVTATPPPHSLVDVTPETIPLPSSPAATTSDAGSSEYHTFPASPSPAAKLEPSPLPTKITTQPMARALTFLRRFSSMPNLHLKVPAVHLATFTHSLRNRHHAPPPVHVPPPARNITDLAPEVFTHSLFYFLTPDEVVRFGWTCTYFHRVALDEPFWRARLLVDMPHAADLLHGWGVGTSTSVLRGLDTLCRSVDMGSQVTPDRSKSAMQEEDMDADPLRKPQPARRTTPLTYRHIYLGLLYPQVYTWGDHDTRLPIPRNTEFRLFGNEAALLRPARITERFVRPENIRGIQSYNSRCIIHSADGTIRFWGLLSSRLPRRIEFPAIRSVSLGSHNIVLVDTDGNVWQQCRSAPLFFHPDIGFQDAWWEPRVPISIPSTSTVTMVATGGLHAAALTKAGEVILWRVDRPERTSVLPGVIQRAKWSYWWSHERNTGQSPNEWEEWWARALDKAGQVEETITDDSDEETILRIRERQKIVDVALGANFVLVLRANGEVWCRSIEFPQDHQDRDRVWHFLPSFSSPLNTKVQARYEYIAVQRRGGWPIVGHFVLSGFSPIPEHAAWLTPRPNVAIADFAFDADHFVALSTNGEAYTWGHNTRGHLGRGQQWERYPPAGRVDFPPDCDGEDPVIIAICATGALALGDGRLPLFRAYREDIVNAPLQWEPPQTRKQGKFRRFLDTPARWRRYWRNFRFTHYYGF